MGGWPGDMQDLALVAQRSELGCAIPAAAAAVPAQGQHRVLPPSQASLCSCAGSTSAARTGPNKGAWGVREGWNSRWESSPYPARRHSWAPSSLCNPCFMLSKESQDDLQKEASAGHTETWSLWKGLIFSPAVLKPPQIHPSPEGGGSGAGGGGSGAVTGSAAALPSGWAAKTPPAPATARRSSGSPRAAPGAGPARSAGSCPPARSRGCRGLGRSAAS